MENKGAGLNFKLLRFCGFPDVAVFLDKLVNTSGGVYDFLRTRKKRMAQRTYFNLDFRNG